MQVTEEVQGFQQSTITYVWWQKVSLKGKGKLLTISKQRKPAEMNSIRPLNLEEKTYVDRAEIPD